MSDRIKVDFDSFDQTINEINSIIHELAAEGNTINKIKNDMRSNWTGEEAETAYRVLGERTVDSEDADDTAAGSVADKENVLDSIQGMVSTQNSTKRMLNQKKQGFADSRTGF